MPIGKQRYLNWTKLLLLVFEPNVTTWVNMTQESWLIVIHETLANAEKVNTRQHVKTQQMGSFAFRLLKPTKLWLWNLTFSFFWLRILPFLNNRCRYLPTSKSITLTLTRFLHIKKTRTPFFWLNFRESLFRKKKKKKQWLGLVCLSQIS